MQCQKAAKRLVASPGMKDYFDMKHFRVCHDRCAMKVGTDGALLGAWADVANTRRALDIGAGSGLISLMLAQRGVPFVCGVEIDASAAQQAVENVAFSPYAQRIAIRQCDAMLLPPPSSPYDLVVSNPPFFTETLQAPDASRALARHAAALTLPHLARVAAMQLSRGGRLCVVLPYDKRSEMLSAASTGEFTLRRELRVVTAEGKAPKRVLLDFGWRMPSAGAVSAENLTLLQGNGMRTEEYVRLMRDFYLW